jgi:UDP-N-acetylmuramyl pentapeptide phosphotransferase/UDP-N-acetylglucosamine-1-phosphate transferase
MGDKIFRFSGISSFFLPMGSSRGNGRLSTTCGILLKYYARKSLRQLNKNDVPGIRAHQGIGCPLKGGLNIPNVVACSAADD